MYTQMSHISFRSQFHIDVCCLEVVFMKLHLASLIRDDLNCSKYSPACGPVMIKNPFCCIVNEHFFASAAIYIIILQKNIFKWQIIIY